MIHKTKKGEGKKYITIPLRWEFRLFRPDSRLISAVLVVGQYGPIWPDSGRISPVQCESSRVGANPRKKKKLRRGTDARATTLDAASHVGPRRTRVRHPPSHIHAFQILIYYHSSIEFYSMKCCLSCCGLEVGTITGWNPFYIYVQSQFSTFSLWAFYWTLGNSEWKRLSI